MTFPQLIFHQYFHRDPRPPVASGGPGPVSDNSEEPGLRPGAGERVPVRALDLVSGALPGRGAAAGDAGGAGELHATRGRAAHGDDAGGGTAGEQPLVAPTEMRETSEDWGAQRFFSC